MPELLVCCALPCSHSRLFCALRCCLLLLNFAFFSTTYVRPLSHLSLLAFVTFFNLHISLSPIFHTLLSPFFFINSCAFSYCLSFLLNDEASGRNVVNSTVCVLPSIALLPLLNFSQFAVTYFSYFAFTFFPL